MLQCTHSKWQQLHGTGGVTGPFSNPAIPGRCQDKTLYPARNVQTYGKSIIQHYNLRFTLNLQLQDRGLG